MHEHLDVPYHQQDTDVYCGGACAQMVLRAIGQPLLPQDGLYNDNHTHSIEPAAWLTPPDGLCWTLNNRQAVKHFVLDSTDSEEPISRTLCWAIHRYQCASIVLVYGGNHWVVVRGYSASAAPTGPHDTSYTIDGFDLNNPWPPVPSAPGPPPHADGDVCGSGGSRGVADLNVSYATWQSYYLTANGFGAQWLGRFVAVCDPDPPDPPFPPRPADPSRLSPAVERERLRAAQPLLAAESIRAGLAGMLRNTGLLSHPVWSRILENVSAGDALLVERLDRPNSEYWIVPTIDVRGNVRALVGIDARLGDYEQAMSVPSTDASLFVFVDVAKVIEHVLNQPLAPSGPAAAPRLQRDAISVHPTLVWRPCRESLSPFYPFRMVVAGAQRLYVRVYDGALFSELTNDRGGL